MSCGYDIVDYYSEFVNHEFKLDGVNLIDYYTWLAIDIVNLDDYGKGNTSELKRLVITGIKK